MAEKSVEVVLVSHIEPCLIITPRAVFKVEDGRMKELEPGPELAEDIKALWLSQALDKDFDPARAIR